MSHVRWLALLLAVVALGCGRSPTNETADAPLDSELVTAADTIASKAGAPESPQEFARRVAVLTRQAEEHQQRGYFEHAIAAREELVALLSDHFGADSWEARSAQLTLTRERRIQEFDSVKRAKCDQALAELRHAHELWKGGQQAQAIATVKNACALSIEVWGEQDFSTANLLDQQARWSLATGDLAAAEVLLRRVLATREQVFGHDHPDAVATTSDLGLLLQVKGQLADSESLLRDAAERASQLWGEQHVQHAAYLNNLAMLLHQMGREEEAIALLKRTVDIRRQVLGEKNQAVAEGLLNLGSVQYAQQDYVNAATNLHAALALLDAALGGGHSLARLARTNLALTLLAQRDFTKAEELLRTDLEWTQKELGERHPDYAEILSRLAALYGNQGRYDEALPLAERAAAIHRSAAGPADSHTRGAEELVAKIRTAAARATSKDPQLLSSGDPAQPSGGAAGRLPTGRNPIR